MNYRDDGCLPEEELEARAQEIEDDAAVWARIQEAVRARDECPCNNDYVPCLDCRAVILERNAFLHRDVPAAKPALTVHQVRRQLATLPGVTTLTDMRVIHHPRNH